MLVILDGRGVTQDPEVSAIAQARTPVFDRILREHPHTTLKAHGEAVGLPEFQMGNSEVGHMHLGAGRILYQDLVKISRAMHDGTFERHPFLQAELRHVLAEKTTLHLVGLASTGGVHSHSDHLYGLIDVLHSAGLPNVVLHLITDGRDTEPTSFLPFLLKLQKKLNDTNIRIGTIVGRYYAMDRDERRERIQVAYDALVFWKGERTDNPVSAIQERYEQGQTDEFLQPIIVWDDSVIQSGDTVFFRNYRNDRMKEVVTALTQREIESFPMKPLAVRTLTMTTYDPKFRHVQVLFPKDHIYNTLGDIISQYEKTQVRIAETEKYPHVTYFFSGGREEPFAGEERMLCPSPKVTTYDLQPEMSADLITKKAIDVMHAARPHFICINYANPDMVGHTGNIKATIQAVETVDNYLGMLLDEARRHDYEVLIVADHGNAEQMLTESLWPHTAHTVNPVPCVYVGSRTGAHLREGKSLIDIAPTILELLGLPKPPQMTGTSLFVHDPMETMQFLHMQQ